MEASRWTGEYLMGKVLLLSVAQKIEAMISRSGTGSSAFSPGWLNAPVPKSCQWPVASKNQEIKALTPSPPTGERVGVSDCDACSIYRCCQGRKCPLVTINKNKPTCRMTREMYETLVKIVAYGQGSVSKREIDSGKY